MRKQTIKPFKWCCGFTPDNGKTQFLLTARTMRELRSAWNSISGNCLEFDPDAAIKVDIQKVGTA